MNEFLIQLTTTGVNVVSDDTYFERLDICNNCENKNLERCTSCGCTIKYLAASHEGSCPINKW